MSMKNIKFKINDLYFAVLFIFIGTLYAFYEYRLFTEVIYMIVFAFYFISKRKRLTFYSLWSLAVILVFFITSFWSINQSTSLTMTRKMVEIAIISNLLIGFIDDKQKADKFYKILVFSGFLLIIRIFVSVPPSEWFAGRFGNVLINANRVGLFLAISAISSFYIARVKREKRYYVFLLILLVFVMLTGSRKATVMALGGIVFLIYLNADNITKKVTVVFYGTILIFMGYYLLLNVPILYNSVGIRLENMVSTFLGSGVVDNSTRVRRNMIEVGLSLIKEKPLMGYGADTYRYISGYGMYSHNNFIELLVGIGVIGTLVYYFNYFYIILKLKNKRKFKFTNAALAFIVMLLSMEYGLVSYYDELYHMLIAFAYATTRFKITSK